MRFSISSLFTLGICFGTTRAYAETPPAPPPSVAARPYYAPAPDLVPVRIASKTPGLHYWLLRADDDTPVVHCSHACVVHVPRGKYRLDVSSTAQTRGGTPRVKIDGPSTISVRAPDYSSRWVGLGTALGGHAVMAGGLQLMLSNLCFMDSCGDSQLRSLGMMMLVTGGVAAPIGWVHFAKNSAARASVDPAQPREARQRRAATIALASDGDGASVHSVIRF
ncbi:MAG TPA: hypothetical protein VI072_00395 [Polyangiaceae bacterium]